MIITVFTYYTPLKKTLKQLNQDCMNNLEGYGKKKMINNIKRLLVCTELRVLIMFKL